MGAAKKLRKKTQSQNAPPQSGVTKHEVALAREKTQVFVRVIDAGASVVKQAIKWGAIAFISWVTRGAIVALAGKETSVLFLGILEGLGDLKTVAPWSLTVLVSAAWVHERRARKKHVLASSPHIALLEARIDPGRSSSKLTPTGETRKEDHD